MKPLQILSYNILIINKNYLFIISLRDAKFYRQGDVGK
jgi:hypothetical protein